MDIIPYSRQHITDEDVAAVSEVMRKDYITRGPKTRELEVALCELTQKKHCVVVSNGTMALWAALRAMGGDKIVTSTLTFFGIATAATLNGLWVNLVDVDDETLCADWTPSPYAEEIIFCPMDYAGYPSLRSKVPFPILLDACHSIGATLPSGESNTKYADIAVGSGHAVKQITGAELGFLVTDEDYYDEILREIRDTGRRYGQFHTHSLNLHISELNSALYLSQLKRITQNLTRRRE